MTRVPVHMDPFFDGESVPAGAASTRAQAYTPDPQAYHPASAVALQSGRTLASAMPQGIRGLQGTIIPRATLGGVPAGVRPSRLGNVQVNIDPHIGSQRSTVRLGDITEAAVAQATDVARQQTPDPYDIITQRLRGAAIMHEIAAQTHQPGAPLYQPEAYLGNFRISGVNLPQPPAYQPPQVPTYQLPTPVYQPPVQYQQPTAAPQTITNPLRTFRQAEANQQYRELRSIDLSRSPSPDMAPRVPTPTIRVTYEIEHFGVHSCKYHDVVIEEGGGFIVLIYDSAFDGDPYFPPVAEGEHPAAVAMNVNGTGDVYLVQPTGVQYTYQGTIHCVLVIEQKAPLNEPDAAPPTTSQPVHTPSGVISGVPQLDIDYHEGDAPSPPLRPPREGVRRS